MAARVVVPAEQDHGLHLQKTKELLKAACREGPLAQGVSGCASVVGVCKGTPGHSPAQTPLVTQEPSQLRLPRLWPQDGSTESLLSPGLNDKVAGNGSTAWHFRLPLAQDDSPARGKNQTQPEDAKTVVANAPSPPLRLSAGDNWINQEENILKILFPLQNQSARNPLPSCPQPPSQASQVLILES